MDSDAEVSFTGRVERAERTQLAFVTGDILTDAE